MASAALYPFLEAMVVVVSTNDEVKLWRVVWRRRQEPAGPSRRPIAEFIYFAPELQTTNC